MVSRSSGQINQKSYLLSHQVLKILFLKSHYIQALLSAHRKNRGEPCVSCHLSIQNQLRWHPVPSFPGHFRLSTQPEVQEATGYAPSCSGKASMQLQLQSQSSHRSGTEGVHTACWDKCRLPHRKCFLPWYNGAGFSKAPVHVPRPGVWPRGMPSMPCTIRFPRPHAFPEPPGRLPEAPGCFFL